MLRYGCLTQSTKPMTITIFTDVESQSDQVMFIMFIVVEKRKEIGMDLLVHSILKSYMYRYITNM